MCESPNTRDVGPSGGSRIEAVDDETKGDEGLGQAWRELAVIGRLSNPRRVCYAPGIEALSR